MFLRAGLIAAALLLAAPAWAEVPVPPVARVTDQTGTLSRAQQQALSDRLAAFEQAKGSQIAVLVLPTTEPETIEQYAIRVAEAWRLGRRGVDDGALLLVAMRDRAVRIEVGYGLEGAIPDAIAKRVIEEVILPRFRAGDLPGGIEAGVDRLIGLVDGEPLPEPDTRRTGSRGEAPAALPVLFFVALALGQGLRRALGPAFAGLIVGGLSFVLIWWLVGVAFFAALVGVAVFFTTLVGMRGGFHGGGAGRGGFGGGGFGGGFSGGGGGFGGGGASGRW
ncbi:TPM domain-containing protein [Sinimarinibacterium flocculans]|uniref:TPM domain-containing protein n=1 Tax=Sinimarinibacterium flocculans TaxID=985250 RepID=A0A318EB76_9GAMM|nr:TPM domain-containing protein [Sinimarinibacterium flocculans]PXV69741.1 uncharacterized protein C8D93_103317 [Sinimarinibacterium flocculans]